MRTNEAVFQYPPAIAALLLLLFILLLYYLEKRRKPDYDADPSKKKPRYKKAASITKNEDYPSDGEHRSAEQAYWRWQMNVEERRHKVTLVTLLLSVFALFAAGLSFWESRTQANAAQEQITAMRDAQRPWLKLSSIEGISATRGQGGNVVWFGFKPTYKNVGQTPAQAIDFVPHIFVIGTGPSPTKTCEADKRSYSGGTGKIAFPQDETPDDETAVQVPLAELIDHAAKVHAIQPKTFIYLGVIGCVVYVFTGDSRIHVLGFEADVYQASDGNVERDLYETITNKDGPINVGIKISHLSFWAD